MTMAFWEGYLWGLGMVIFVGPVFFTLLQAAFQHGFKSGFAVALGIIVSDIVVVALCGYVAGAADFFKNTDNQFWIALVGAVILLGLGIKYVIKPDLNVDADIKLKTSDYLNFFTKGFLVNFVNPFVFLVWITLIGFKSKSLGMGLSMWVFLTGALLGILTTDTLKAVFAPWLKQFLSQHTLIWVYRIIGILLVGFGVRLVVFAISSIPT